MEFRELARPIKVLFYLVLILVALSVVYPVFWMSYTAFKTNPEVLQHPFGLPTRLNFANIVEAWQTGHFSRLYLNSILVCVVSVLGVIAVSTATAYALARYRFSGNRFLFLYFLFGLAVPTQALVIPSFKLMATLDMWAAALHLHIAFRNSPLSLILTYMSWSPLAVIFIRAYFSTIPKEIEEAARMDGAGEFQIFQRIMVPLAMPAIATMAIFYFVGIWNDFLWPLVYVQSDTWRTIPLGLMTFQGKYTTYWSLQMASLSLATWPPIIFYMVFRGRIQRGLTDGALKF
jgi:ABC-type glycerol-3-phosphate transport system permease component